MVVSIDKNLNSIMNSDIVLTEVSKVIDTQLSIITTTVITTTTAITTTTLTITTTAITTTAITMTTIIVITNTSLM